MRSIIEQQCTKFIVRNPRILDGEPTVKGSRISVRAIVELHRLYPDLNYLREAFPSISTEAIVDALAFYEGNREEIDRYIEENSFE
ncbi:MAG: DUF433 domain-containing protein [Chloroflexi bacterium]|nr:DUF433 domain-containing protein [Chloroflexota bacterium]